MVAQNNLSNIDKKYVLLCARWTNTEFGVDGLAYLSHYTIVVIVLVQIFTFP